MLYGIITLSSVVSTSSSLIPFRPLRSLSSINSEVNKLFTRLPYVWSNHFLYFWKTIGNTQEQVIHPTQIFIFIITKHVN